MSANVYPEITVSRRSPIIWLAPIQAAAAFTVLAVIAGGQMLRSWILAALFFLMAFPLMVSLEAGLVAMIMFEPFRGLTRRLQYLIVDYSQFDPIHVLTPLVALMALARLLQRHRFHIINATPLAGAVTILAGIFFVQIFNPLQGGMMIGLSGAMLMLVPVSWFYFGQVVNLRLIQIVLRLIVGIGIVTSLYGVYQLIYGYPDFERYWLEHLEFYVSIGVGHVKRPVATFSNAEEWGRYIGMGALIAFGFGVGAKQWLSRAGWLLCTAGLSSVLLFTGQRTAIFGLLLGFATLIVLGAKNLRGAAVRVALLLVPVLLITVLAKPPSEDEMWSKEDTETVGTLLSHTQRGTLQPTGEDSLYVRFEIWQELVTTVIPYRPLGSGLGAGSLSALKFSSGAEETAIDNFILVLAVACGIPGALLFVWILGRATLFAFRQTRRAMQSTSAMPASAEATTARIIAALMPIFILNNIFGLTFSLYAVAPIGWLLIGWVSAQEGRNQEQEQTADAGVTGQ
ncbi:MAG: O-antigen ligase family protein [Pyrinomonadaceae bacterium]|nr:O-antigen ligase family protein [Pyrinomonadaceae bacterium]